MTDKVDKPKKSKAKPKKDEQGVLAALPSTRAERIGTRRASAPKMFEEPAAAQAAASPPAAAPEPAKPKAAAKPPAAAPEPAKPKAAAKPAARKPATKSAAAKKAGARATAKPVAPRTFEPTRAAEAAAGGGAAEVPSASVPPPPPPPRASEPRPRPVREGAPGIGTSGARDEPAPERGRPSGVEIVTTAVQTVGELTQVGLKVGGRIVKRAVDRLPKP